MRSIAEEIRNRHIKILQQKHIDTGSYYINILPYELIEELLLYFSYKELIELKHTILCNHLTRRYWIKNLNIKSKLPNEAFIDILNETDENEFYKLIFNTNHVQSLDITMLRTALYNQSLMHGYVSIVKYVKEHDIKLIYHSNKTYKNNDADAIIFYLKKDNIDSKVIKDYVELKLIDLKTLYNTIKKKLFFIHKFQDELLYKDPDKYYNDVIKLTKAEYNLKNIMGK